jgi:hypothetical protein
VAVFEMRPWWAPELQRQFCGESIAVRACRSVEEALQADLAVLQWAAAHAGVLHSLGQRMAAGSGRGVIILASPELFRFEWDVRQLGVDTFVSERLAGEDMARLCRRLLNKVCEQTWLTPV